MLALKRQISHFFFFPYFPIFYFPIFYFLIFYFPSSISPLGILEYQ